jgi:hypothetical protein
LEELDWAFGTMGTGTKAKHLAALYLEDISDFMWSVDAILVSVAMPNVWEDLPILLTNYMKRSKEPTYIDTILLDSKRKIEDIQPTLFLISVPFPGNLYSAFRSAQWVKASSNIRSMGLIQLRSLSDARVLSFDFITLDDGEMPIEELINAVTSSAVES